MSVSFEWPEFIDMRGADPEAIARLEKSMRHFPPSPIQTRLKQIEIRLDKLEKRPPE